MSDDTKEPSRALPMAFYRDPLELLLDIESETCAGCAYEDRVLDVTFCRKGRHHGRRCKHYLEETRRVPIG